MIKILELGVKRQLSYGKAMCPYCGTILAFKDKDIWFEAPDGARITCANPGCGMKIFLKGVTHRKAMAELITEQEYNSAHGDMSKSGLQMLMDEKKELENDRDECYASFYNEKEAETVDKEVYDNAHSDTSKSRFQMFVEKLKEKEAMENEDNNR